MSASIRSRSTRFQPPSGPLLATAPDPGYYTYDATDLGHQARSLNNSRSQGAFGGRSARDLPWQDRDLEHNRGQSIAESRIRSDFDSASQRGRPPSAGFAGHDNRFGPPREELPGPGAYYVPSPLSNSTRINRSSSFGSKAKRFGLFKDLDTPAPGSFEAKPGAFAKATRKQSPMRSTAGFGSRSERGSPFVKSMEMNAAPPPGAYDVGSRLGAAPAYAAPRGSSPRRDASPRRAASPRPERGGGNDNEPKRASAAFASRSSRFRRVSDSIDTGPDPTAYNVASYGSMGSARTFNKQAGKGAGTFGSSARRPEQWLPGGDGAPHASYTMREVTPGPGQYEDAIQKDEKVRRRSSSPRPSSAFATRTEKGNSYCKPTDAPLVDYDLDRGSMAAQANKSFNKLCGKGGFGSRAARPLEGPRFHLEPTPAPGDYAAADPTRPATADISRRNRTTREPMAAAGPRDTTKWTGAHQYKLD